MSFFRVSSKDIGLLGGVAAAFAVGLYVFWGPQFRVTHTRKKKGKCPGLVNQGNTCFLNAILQSLASCPSFVSWLDDYINSHSNDDCSQYMAYTLIRIMKVLCNDSQNSDDPYNPVEVLNALRVRNWVISWEEQDAHELFHVLTTTLSEEADHFTAYPSLLDVGKLEATCGMQDRARSRCQTQLLKLPGNKMEHPFGGSFASQLTCKQCGYKCPIKYDNFDSISLSLPPRSSGCLSLESLLHRFIMSEIVEDVECSGCARQLAKYTRLATKKNGLRNDRIKPKATFLKQLNIGKLPQCLCIHINRRIWLSNGMPMKREDVVQFPEVLNMDHFRYWPQINNKKGVSHSPINEKHSPIDTSIGTQYFSNGAFDMIKPRCVMSGLPRLYRNGFTQSLVRNKVSDTSTAINAVFQRQFSMECNYRLMSVVVHRGDAYSGHFVTYRRIPTALNEVPSNKWLFTSDSTVRKVALQEVMSSPVYMLYYEKIHSR